MYRNNKPKELTYTVYDKTRMSLIYKELSQSNKKANMLVERWTNGKDGQFTKEGISVPLFHGGGTTLTTLAKKVN